MATFYLLPPRETLEQTLSTLLGQLLPGLPLPAESWDLLVERLASQGQWPDDVYLVARDDLPDDEPIDEALRTGFGAEPGDRIIEVRLARSPSMKRTWILQTDDVSHIAIAR